MYDHLATPKPVLPGTSSRDPFYGSLNEFLRGQVGVEMRILKFSPYASKTHRTTPKLNTSILQAADVHVKPQISKRYHPKAPKAPKPASPQSSKPSIPKPL